MTVAVGTGCSGARGRRDRHSRNTVGTGPPASLWTSEETGPALIRPNDSPWGAGPTCLLKPWQLLQRPVLGTRGHTGRSMEPLSPSTLKDKVGQPSTWAGTSQMNTQSPEAGGAPTSRGARESNAQVHMESGCLPGRGGL